MEKYLLFTFGLLFVESIVITIAYASLLDACESHQQCNDTKYAYCVSGLCDCLPNYGSGIRVRTCKGGINATCDSDDECQNQREVGCFFNTCQNTKKFLTESSVERVKLYRASVIGSPCKTDEHCSNIRNTACKSGRCDCVSGYWMDYNDICKPVTNKTCTDDLHCKEYGTKCLLGQCILPTDFFVESNAFNTTLFATKYLGDICHTDHHCRNLKGSKCNHRTCQCPDDSISVVYLEIGSNIRKQKCQNVLNFPCVENRDCRFFPSPGAKCFLNICLNPEAFFVPSNAHNVSLYAAKDFKDICRTDDHCRNVENTRCVAGRCNCLEGYGYMSGKCRNLSDLFCTHDYNCKIHDQGALCFSNYCRYESDYFESANISQYRAERIKGYCRIDVNCRNLNNTECHDNECVCKHGYTNEFVECRKESPADCSKDLWCRGGTYCFFGFCHNPTEFFELSSAETLDRYAADHYYDFCRTDHHCRNFNNSHCNRGYCECLHDWSWISGHCQQTVNVTCSDDSECLNNSTHCFLNTCLYADDFFHPSNADNINRYFAKRIYGYCRSDHHCRNLNNTYCLKEACNCLPGYENVDGYCEKAINVTCSDDSDCLLPISYCFLDTCLYPEDFLAPSNGYNTSLYAAKRIDGFCQTNYHCRMIEDSICFHRRCICKDQYSFNGIRCQSIHQ